MTDPSADQPAAAVDASPEPGARRRRLGLVVGLASGVVVLALVVVGVFAVGVPWARGHFFGPQLTAQAYFDALARGDSAAARALSGQTKPGTGLESPAAYRAAKDHPVDAVFGTPTVSRDDATIPVTYSIGGAHRSITLSLTRTSTTALIRDSWVIAPVEERVVVESSHLITGATLKSEGVDVGTLGATGIALTGLLGTYDFTVPPTKYFGVYGTKVQIAGSNTTATADVSLGLSPRKALVTETQANIVNLVKKCVATGGAGIKEGCPLGTPVAGSFDIRYTLEHMPTLTTTITDDRAYVTSPDEPGKIGVAYSTYVPGGYENWTAEITFTIGSDFDVQQGKLVRVDDY